MTYQWKLTGVIPVEAETAGEELTRISEKYGRLEAKTIVSESRDEKAPLHTCFEWDDSIAAERFRENQAKEIVRLLVVTTPEVTQTEPVRAFVSIDRNYEPIQKVVSVADKRQKMLDSAIAEMKWFSHKYKVLSEMQPVIAEMQTVIEKYSA